MKPVLLDKQCDINSSPSRWSLQAFNETDWHKEISLSNGTCIEQRRVASLQKKTPRIDKQQTFMLLDFCHDLLGNTCHFTA